MPSVEAHIVNKLGLHARAAAKLTHIASGFQSDIWLSRSGRRVNAKSIMGVMMLAAGRGATVTVEADGADADAALAAITKLIADRFGAGAADGAPGGALRRDRRSLSARAQGRRAARGRARAEGADGRPDDRRAGDVGGAEADRRGARPLARRHDSLQAPSLRRLRHGR